jgi:hypothetical protein
LPGRRPLAICFATGLDRDRPGTGREELDHHGVDVAH